MVLIGFTEKIPIRMAVYHLSCPCSSNEGHEAAPAPKILRPTWEAGGLATAVHQIYPCNFRWWLIPILKIWQLLIHDYLSMLTIGIVISILTDFEHSNGLSSVNPKLGKQHVKDSRDDSGIWAWTTYHTAPHLAKENLRMFDCFDPCPSMAITWPNFFHFWSCGIHFLLFGAVPGGKIIIIPLSMIKMIKRQVRL